MLLCSLKISHILAQPASHPQLLGLKPLNLLLMLLFDPFFKLFSKLLILLLQVVDRVLCRRFSSTDASEEGACLLCIASNKLLDPPAINELERAQVLIAMTLVYPGCLWNLLLVITVGVF